MSASTLFTKMDLDGQGLVDFETFERFVQTDIALKEIEAIHAVAPTANRARWGRRATHGGRHGRHHDEGASDSDGDVDEDAWRERLPLPPRRLGGDGHQRRTADGDYELYVLPSGWTPAMSLSKEDQVVFENVHTEERIEWLPRRPASRQEDQSDDFAPGKGAVGGWHLVDDPALPGGVAVCSDDLPDVRVAWPQSLRAPPEGWQGALSRSRPGVVVFVNARAINTFPRF